MAEIKIVVAFEKGMTRKEHERTFWGNENILRLDFRADYMGVNICHIEMHIQDLGMLLCIIFNSKKGNWACTIFFLINSFLIWPLTKSAFHQKIFSFFPALLTRSRKDKNVYLRIPLGQIVIVQTKSEVSAEGWQQAGQASDPAQRWPSRMSSQTLYQQKPRVLPELKRIPFPFENQC